MEFGQLLFILLFVCSSRFSVNFYEYKNFVWFTFLIAAIVTIPLVLLIVTLIIPILFFIIAMMMFARRDRIETVPSYYNEYDQPYYDERGFMNQSQEMNMDIMMMCMNLCILKGR